MDQIITPSSDIAFTPAVKAIQSRKGSRNGYARMEADGGWRTTVTPDLVSFLAGVRSFFFATANAAGQPYVQHRGGPPGFLRLVDDKTLGIVDLKGNRQFISQGNLTENTQAFLFLIDYTVNRRAKLTPYRRGTLTPFAASRSGPEPTELITEWRRVRP